MQSSSSIFGSVEKSQLWSQYDIIYFINIMSCFCVHLKHLMKENRCLHAVPLVLVVLSEKPVPKFHSEREGFRDNVNFLIQRVPSQRLFTIQLSCRQRHPSFFTLPNIYRLSCICTKGKTHC